MGRYALVGAGAVVLHDVPDHALIVGVPSTVIGWVGRTGERLDDELICPVTGEQYVVAGDGLALEAS